MAYCVRRGTVVCEVEMSLETAIQIIIAFGTLSVAILAIWGNWFQAKLAGPKLKLILNDPAGILLPNIENKEQPPARYYHIKVSNERSWSPARAVRVMITQIDRKTPANSYAPERQIIPLQVQWSHQEYHELLPTIANSDDRCDLGYLNAGADKFILSTFFMPTYLKGHISKGESCRVYIKAFAENYESKKPLVIEISWDGQWEADSAEMQKHLVVKEIH